MISRFINYTTKTEFNFNQYPIIHFNLLFGPKNNEKAMILFFIQIKSKVTKY